MVVRNILGRTSAIAVVLTLVIASAGEAAAQRNAQKALRNLGIGIGGAILLNEAMKAQARERRKNRSAASSSRPQQRARNARQGEDASRIRALQIALAAQGYDVGDPDGVWGRKARMAAMSFQRSLGSEQTGRLTGDEIELLSDETEGRVSPQVTAELLRAASIADEMVIGSDSPEHEIRQVQASLKNMGLYRGTVDGAWGSGTEQSVRRYQRQLGEPQTGVLNEREAAGLLVASTATSLAGGAPPRTDERLLGTQMRLAEAKDYRTQDIVADAEPIRNNDVIRLGSSSLAGYADLQPAIDKFKKRLIVTARPEIVQDPDSAKSIASLAGSGVKKYIVRPYGDSEGEPDGFWRWKGNDEFQREESRQGFLQEYEAQILASRISFPTEVIELRPTTLGDYDHENGAFPLNVHTAATLESYGWFGISMPTPYGFPTHWAVDPQGARTVLGELQRIRDEYAKRSVTMAIRYRIDGVRLVSDTRLVVDAVPVSYEIYMSKTLEPSTKLASLPNPASRQIAETAPGSAEGVHLFEAELPRLYAIKLSGGNLEDDAVWQETAEIRRKIERQEVGGNVSARTGTKQWPIHFSPAVIGSNADLQPSDIARFKEWTVERAQQVPAAFRLAGQGLHWKLVDHKLTFDASATLRAHSLSERGGSETKYALTTAKELYPSSIGAEVLTAAPNFITVAIMKLHDGWAATFDMKANGRSSGRFDGFSEYDIVGSRLHTHGPSGRIVFLEVQPRRLLLAEPGEERREVVFSLAAEKVQATAAPQEKQFDVLGVVIGMPADDAIQKLKNSYSSAKLTRETIGRAASSLYPTACQMDQFRRQAERERAEAERRAQLSLAKINGKIGAEVEIDQQEPVVSGEDEAVCGDQQQDESKSAVTAFYRKAVFSDGVTEWIGLVRPGATRGSPDMIAITRRVVDGEKGRLFRDGLKQRWGKPDREDNEELIWAAEPEIAQQVRLNKLAFQERCFFKGRRLFTDGELDAEAVKADCGELAWAVGEDLIVVDTSAVMKLKERAAVEKQPEPLKPQIRF